MPVPTTGPDPSRPGTFQTGPFDSNSFNPGRPNDAAALMQYDANKRSALVAYLLWFFLGTFGAHRFYAGRIASGVVQLLVTLVSMLLTFVLIGYAGLFLVGLWVLVDALLIPGMIRSYNNRLIASLGRQH
ncbi:TM2 domain-containing protein [Muricoccus nepalensis]|nr:TM2 domain-containing protein [Roseomonas nepalensis]